MAGRTRDGSRRSFYQQRSDVTNYILFLFGQPLHAFDYDKLVDETGKANVIVRAAKEGEKLQTLDGEERELTEDMTVIATPEKAVGLAGVMVDLIRK